MTVVVFFTAVILQTVVNCQSVPQFENGGNNLTNNSYIYYANISDGDSALKCVTDSDNCCNDSHVGDWTDERGRAVQQGADEATCLYVTRGHGVVSLNRKSDCIPESSGLWRCDIPDSSEVIQSIYIYISNDTSSGQLMTPKVEFILHTEPRVSPPEFTIICRSKGGPATNASWYKSNGQRIEQVDSDHETSQIIVDTRNSVYENRLRVRGRENGTYICAISNNIKDYFPNLTNVTYRAPGIEFAQKPTNFNAFLMSNSTHVNITVTWESPQRLNPGTRLTGYIIYYQPKGGAVRSVNVSKIEKYVLTGLQRGVTYNISIVAVSLRTLPSPLIGPITVIPELVIIMEVSPSSVTVSPCNEFTVTCTARVELDGLPLEKDLVMMWTRITTSPSGFVYASQLEVTEYDITTTGSPESGYQSILTTTENDTVNMIIYQCRARISGDSPITNFSHITVFVEEPLVILDVTPSSLTTLPNEEFTVTCTVRAEIDGQGLPLETLRWTRITTCPSGSVQLIKSTTVSPESGYQSILTTTENDTVNMIIYRCTASCSNTTEIGDVSVLVGGIDHCPDMSCTDNTAVVTGGVGGVMGLIIIIQSVVIVIIIQYTVHSRAQSRKLNSTSSTEGEDKMVVTSSNAAYGVVSVEQEHEYEVMELQKTHAQHLSTLPSNT